jgi:hypothetical protein
MAEIFLVMQANPARSTRSFFFPLLFARRARNPMNYCASFYYGMRGMSSSSSGIFVSKFFNIGGRIEIATRSREEGVWAGRVFIFIQFFPIRNLMSHVPWIWLFRLMLFDHDEFK